LHRGKVGPTSPQHLRCAFFQRSFSAGLSGHELPAIDDFNGSKAATEGGNKTENRQSLCHEMSINQSAKKLLMFDLLLNRLIV
jgi:hypothetical protein